MSEFYIIGTKYGAKNDKDIIPYLLKKNVVSMEFCLNLDLSQYYAGDLQKLDLHLREKGEKPSTIGQVKRFLSLQPGDLIALKSNGSPDGTKARLEIVGYAVVVDRKGVVYTYDPSAFPQGLGHQINVEFLETDIKRTVQLGYGQTVHHLTNKDHIDLIFGSYVEALSVGKTKTPPTTKLKNTSETNVTVSANYLRTAVHNKIQQGAYEIFVVLFGEDSVVMEENFVDIIIKTDKSIELMEVKPYLTATQCIREGLGQLLSYYYKHYSERENVSLRIIGSNEPTAEEEKFIKFIQNGLTIKFKYDSWERLSQM